MKIIQGKNDPVYSNEFQYEELKFCINLYGNLVIVSSWGPCWGSKTRGDWGEQGRGEKRWGVWGEGEGAHGKCTSYLPCRKTWFVWYFIPWDQALFFTEKNVGILKSKQILKYIYAWNVQFWFH